MSRVFIGGYYGHGNLGDELVLAAMVARLRAERPGLEIAVTSADPAALATRHGVEAVAWSDIAALVGAAASSDALLLGGGGLFHDYWGCDPDTLLQRHHAGLAQYLAFPLVASLLGKPLMLYAVGVGPLLTEAGRQLTRVAFAQAAVAAVRDEPSRALLAEIGVDTARVEVTADPAFDTPPSVVDAAMAPRADGQAAARPRVAVALRNWSHGVASETWEGQVAEGLDLFLDRRGGEAVFVPFQQAPEPFGDEPVAERVRARMKPGRHHALGSGDPPRVRLAALAGCDVILGMRLHALIMGARAGRPLVGLAYDPKVTSALDRLGAAEFGVDLEALTATTLADRLGDAWQRRGDVGPRLATVSDELARRARTNAAHTLGLLDGPAPQPAGDLTAALLRRTTLRLASAVDDVARKAEDERRLLQGRAEHAEDEVRRWEASRVGRAMRLWRRWRG